jgi:Arc/MetJ-type ribon-helix-helix transcriptional regulator
MTKSDNDDRSITTRILRALYEEVTNHITPPSRYLNEADFIRVAVRTLLDKEKKK